MGSFHDVLSNEWLGPSIQHYVSRRMVLVNDIIFVLCTCSYGPVPSVFRPFLYVCSGDEQNITKCQQPTFTVTCTVGPNANDTNVIGVVCNQVSCYRIIIIIIFDCVLVMPTAVPMLHMTNYFVCRPLYQICAKNNYLQTCLKCLVSVLQQLHSHTITALAATGSHVSYYGMLIMPNMQLALSYMLTQ